MKNLLAGKAVIVTGGTGAIGLAITRQILYCGGTVICGSSSREKAGKTSGILSVEYPTDRFLVCKIDVGNNVDIANAVAKAVERFGKVDGLVNCAGRNLKKPFMDTTANDFSDILGVNLLGAFNMSRKVCQQMIAQGNGGVIVNICSVASFMALSGVTTYAASKAALLALTRQMAVERDLVKAGIRTVAVAPGFIPAEQNRKILAQGTRGPRILMHTPMERYGRPEEVAGPVAFLLSDAASFVNGTCLDVDGGFMAHGVSEAMEDDLTIAPRSALPATTPPVDETQLTGCELDERTGQPPVPQGAGADQPVES